MSTIQILQSAAHRQMASPLFTLLPLEVRLLIYAFTFMHCQATAWFDGEFGESENPAHAGPKPKRFRSGACCFSHSGGGFDLLMTCRRAYIEAFGTYWTQTTLEVARSIDPKRIGCGLVSVCRYLPAEIKQNLGDLRNTKLPIMEVVLSTPDDPTWTPALLRQFPKLRILEFSSMVLFGRIPRRHAYECRWDLLDVPDLDNCAQFYAGVGPFRIFTGESPAEYIERRIGVQLSGGLTLLSTSHCASPLGQLPGYRPRRRHCNWTTGMVHQTTEYSYETLARGYQDVLEAEPGSRWSRWYCLPTDDGYRVSSCVLV